MLLDVPLNMDSIPVTTIPVRVAPGYDVSIDLKQTEIDFDVVVGCEALDSKVPAVSAVKN